MVRGILLGVLRQGAGIVVILAATAYGQQPGAAGPQSLAAAAREAAKNFRPVGPEEIARAKGELASAINSLDRFLRSGAPYKAAGWKKYLQWNDLVGVVQQPQPPTAELSAAVLAKLDGENPGLRMPPFTRVRDALAHYLGAAAAASDETLKDEYVRRMEELAAQLEAYANDPAAGDAALAIGRTLAWLDSQQQAPQILAAVHEAYGHPNFLGHASQRLVAAGIEEDIDRITGVRDYILGTDIHGTARMTGRTTLVLAENPAAASMRILLGGTVVSSSIGYNGPVTLRTTGYTRVAGEKQIDMTPEGLVAYWARASCPTSTTIHSIHARHGMVEKIAWRRAGKQKGQAEAIASQHAAARVAGELNAEAGRLIAEQNARYQEKFRDELRRRGEFPEELVFSSTPQQAMVRVRQDSPGLLAAPGVAPEIASTHDLSVRAHESVVTNFGQGLLGGYELTDLRLEKLILEDLKGELPDELRVTLPDGTLDPEKDPWSIIFAQELPVRCRFSGGGLWIAIRADGFTRGEGDTPGKYRPALTELIEISAAYKIERTDKGATLRRDGDVQVQFPNRADPVQITIRDSPIVTFIRRKFRSMFKEEFIGEGLTFKGRWERAGRLQLQEIQSDAAWLALGWSMPAAAEPPQVAIVEP
jgi:hypothetical protein